MLVDLVRTTTSDGHRLDGALAIPPVDTQRPFNVDAMIMLHGVGSNFYAGNLFDHLAQKLLAAGVAALRVNTRGHDTITVTWGTLGPIRRGAAYEIVDQCQLDVAAWVGFLQQRGFARIGLLGHSLGAIKAIYSQAFAPHPAVQCVIACSAPRLSHSAFMNSDAQPRFFDSLSTARELVKKGEPEGLMSAKFPFPILITASGYLDKYGVEERYNILRFLDQVPAPLLATYGALELENGGVPFAGMPEAIASKRRSGQLLSVEVIAGADHAYSGASEPLSQVLLRWLGSLS